MKTFKPYKVLHKFQSNINFLIEHTGIDEKELLKFLKLKKITNATILDLYRLETLFGISGEDLYYNKIKECPLPKNVFVDLKHKDIKTIYDFVKIVPNYYKMKTINTEET
jgi:hypothetical protein